MMGTLRLNQGIYTRKEIEVAVLAFAELADVEVVSEGVYWNCTFSGCQCDEEITMREFENYLIDLMNSHGD